MKMYEIQISRKSNGDIELTQESYRDGIQEIVISEDQAQVVCKWIMSCAESNPFDVE